MHIGNLTKKERDAAGRKLIKYLKVIQVAFAKDDDVAVGQMVGRSAAEARNVSGICNCIFQLAKRNSATRTGVNDMLRQSFEELYGSDQDPFAWFGHSYFKDRIDWKFRAERIPEIIAHVKANHVRSHKKAT